TPGNHPSVAHNVAPGNHPSVAHNVKSETEHNGLGNNAAPENRPSLTNNVRTGMTSCSCLLGLYFDISQMNAEWHALYTTQKTQKTKKYHDGFLRLLVGVSQRKQVTLLSEDGTVLSSKYLSFSEVVRTGSKLELTGDIQNANSFGTSLTSCPTISTVERMKLNSSDRRNKTKSYGKDLGLYPKSSNVDKDKFSQSGTRTDPIRDAHQILFTLKKGQEGMPPAKEAILQRTDRFFPRFRFSNTQVVTVISQSESFEKLSASGLQNGGVDLSLPSLVGSDSFPEDPERKN
ncbi:hypothetical protein IFM89_028503, partial [Coptis chinensis]